MDRSVSDVLQQGGCSFGPAETHGGLCGSLCAGGIDAGRRWLEQCMDGGLARPLAGPLEAWCQATWSELAAGDLAFELMLPDDDSPLPERVAALAAWCGGFLAGLGCGGGRSAGTHGQSDQVSEIVSDFSEISRAQGDSATTDAEFDLAELIEYVRVSMQLVFEELAAARGSSSPLVH